jgi:hypothetical protein
VFGRWVLFWKFKALSSVELQKNRFQLDKTKMWLVHIHGVPAANTHIADRGKNHHQIASGKELAAIVSRRGIFSHHNSSKLPAVNQFLLSFNSRKLIVTASHQCLPSRKCGTSIGRGEQKWRHLERKLYFRKPCFSL